MNTRTLPREVTVDLYRIKEYTFGDDNQIIQPLTEYLSPCN